MTAGSTFGWSDIYLSRLAAGQLGLNLDSTHGVVLDVNTDGIAKLFTRAGAAGSSLYAGSFFVNGGAIYLGTGGGNTGFSSPASHITQLADGSGTAGVRFDTSTDGTFHVLTRAGADAATIRAAAVTGATTTASTEFDLTNAWAAFGPATGQMRLTNWAGTTAIRLNFATDAQLHVTSGAGADTATVRASQFSNANSTNGQAISALQTLTELTTIAAAASTDTTIQMPANAVVLGVAVYVQTVIPTAATFTVGDSGSAARFSTAAISAAAGSSDSGTKAGAYYNASALSVRITPNVQPADNTGRVRVVIYYYTVTPPTS